MKYATNFVEHVHIHHLIYPLSLPAEKLFESIVLKADNLYCPFSIPAKRRKELDISYFSLILAKRELLKKGYILYSSHKGKYILNIFE
ncbi:hypothetical protein [Ornithinibacillus halophilus]|uniref:Uncharacterized protein n=1 Tax=Ornithinibacillus halophilus TaxID=930117 RepID=A0A1M5KBJ2_9BACI|nr:hypothetical protein [Ornithinibacillus halophilus]SHG50107.1 hypothetical protein SAMN05216225_103716 [Ornithinibacillus halophilus]